MATQEKLQKSLEALKNLSNTNQASDPTRKKEKVQHCHIVTEAMSNPTIKVSTNFQVLLGITIETFLKLCDDPASDIRMTSEECLNRIIRAVSDQHIGKVQIELHKQIKKNGPARSLRAALLRFSQLAHLIRPHKGKPYVVNLFPSIIKISERDEEQIHKTLASCFPKIMKVLGCFSSDNEIKVLLKAFLLNISNQSAVIRRSSCTCILSMCLSSRKPYFFTTYCLNTLIDLLVPVNDIHNSSMILGVMTCFKILIPNIKNCSTIESGFGIDNSTSVATNKLLQVYELCLYYLTHKDHNIINAALEALNILLLNASTDLKKVLLCQNGIDKSRIFKVQSMTNIRSPSQLSVATNLTSTDDCLLSECELTETVHSDIEKWIGESKLSVLNITFANTSEKSPSLDTLVNTSGSGSDMCDYGNMNKIPDDGFKSSSVNDNLDKITMSENSSEKSFSCGEEKILNTEVEVEEIDAGDYLDKDIPLLHCLRLITKSFLLSGIVGNYTSDKLVRVSVKSLALACLSTILQIYPEGFLKHLDRNCLNISKTTKTISTQRISHVLLFADHPDPQLRGTLRSLVANFINSVLSVSRGEYEKWIEKNLEVKGQSGHLEIENLVDILVKGLEDESANCSRQTLLSLNTTLNCLAESRNSVCIVPVLRVLPLLASNPYWLVKVALCELLSKVTYVTIHEVTGNSDFQQKVVHLLFDLLKDSDQRVRSASANAIVEIIPNLYYEDYQTKEDAVTTKAIYLRNKYLVNLCDTNEETNNLNKKYFVKNMPFPFSEIGNDGCDRIDFSLSKILSKVYCFILTSTSKHFISGCIETLSLLSNTFPCTVYKNSWNTLHDSVNLTNGQHVKEGIPDLFSLCVSFFNRSTHIYDLQFQINVLCLAANVYAGQSISILKPVPDLENHTNTWTMFANRSYSDLSDQFLSHVVKLLNIFHHVSNETVPTHPHSKPVLSHLPSVSQISPIKRRKSELERRISITVKSQEKEEKTEKKESSVRANNSIGSFVHSQHYMKIYEAVRSSFTNYKISLDSEASDKFLELMRQTLNALSVIMEIATLNEFGGIAEEILSYLRSTFTLDAKTTVLCVQELLKCLFGTNLTANVSEIFEEETSKKQETDTNEDAFGFYYSMSQKPYNEISTCINALNNINKFECDGDSTLMGYLHRKDVRKKPNLSRTSDKTLSNYIRIFEPVVIKSLKQYTITSDVKLQCGVLQLLSQLVQLRVNYCLLDSEQVFIGFVLKQFEFIEEGQVPFSNELIAKIFQFLVQLSYSKQHSKCIISVPKIIQLCDGLLASGQSPQTHCIPALEPIVEDIFLTRNKSNTIDMKELETTREVVLSMLLRLSEYKEIIRLITLILEDSKYCIDNTEKWLKWSEQVVKVVLPMLKHNKIRLDDADSFVSLRRFIFALNPNVFKPIDDIVVMLFQEPPQMEDKLSFNRWLSKVIVLILILTPLKEEELISKIDELKSEFSPNSIFENVITTADPLNVHNNSDAFQNISSEIIFIRFIFRVISLTLIECLQVNNDENEFLVHQFSVFLMYCLYIFQSGSHCKIVNEAISLINRNIPFEKEDVKIEEINNGFLSLLKSYPTLTFQWCYILTLLNYDNSLFWNEILKVDDTAKNCPCVNEEVMKIGGTVVFCDYVSEIIGDSDQWQWLLSQNIEKLVDLIDENPVADFISSVHRNAKTSKIFIENISQKCLGNDNPIFKLKILKCIENSHPSQFGAVVNLLIPKMLNYRQIAVTRAAANLASRKIEFMLTLSMEDVNSQLSKEELIEIKKKLISLNLVKKNEALVGLLNKLLVQYYDLSPLEFDQRRLVNPDYIKKLHINKKWYTTQIQEKYSDGKLTKETADLMNRLEYNEIASFMCSSEFNRLCLRDCVLLGVKSIKNGHMKEEPDILKASVDCLLKDIGNISTKIPKPHQVFSPTDRQPTLSESNYTSQMIDLFKDRVFSNLLITLSAPVFSFIDSLPSFPTIKISESNFEEIMNFGVVSLEYTNYLIETDKTSFNVDSIDVLLNSASCIFKDSHLANLLGSDMKVSWLCSAVNSLFKLVSFLLKNEEPLPIVSNSPLKSTLDNQDTLPAGQACYQLYILVCWLCKIKNQNVNIPKFLLGPVKRMIVSLARLPLVNSYGLIPEKVWKTGWQPEFSGSFNTQVPPLSIELLQEIDVLEEYIFRITLLGWTSRQQFEETWMCLLGVLCAHVDSSDPADINDAVHASSLAIKAITTLLLQTLQFPMAGNPNVSKLLHVSRNPPISDGSVSIKKLKNVHRIIEQKYDESSRLCGNAKIVNVFDQINFEKISDKYSYGEISIRYFLIATNIIEEPDDDSVAAVTYRNRERMLQESGLDVNSCLQFLLDYFTQLMKPQSMTHLKILHEAVKSTVMISDLFTDKSQFSWMMEVFLELSKLHAVEDELLHQHLIVGICKAVAVLTPHLEIYENVKKLLVQYLKSPYLSSRIACLYGLLYILEGCKLSNITIGGISEEMQLILPCAVEYVQLHLNTNNRVLRKSQEHTTLTWSLAFYLVENVDEVHMESSFVTNSLQSAFTVTQDPRWTHVHNSIIKGLERLLVTKKKYILDRVAKQTLKLALEKMRDNNPLSSILGTQLLLSYMYNDCTEHLENTKSSANSQTNPDHLVLTIEKISAIFERIRKGYVMEVEVLCSVLPTILEDFFLPSDILTKVIGEFLSPQQPHPKFLSRVVFQVFESAINQNQLCLLQDWVVFSLSNFTQSFSMGMATWCLTCFFISASSNEWLRSYFPYVQTRVGRYDHEDKKMLCIAGSDFYKNLINDNQKRTFVEHFKKVKDQPDMPFNDLLFSL